WALEWLHWETCIRAGGHRDLAHVCYGARENIASVWAAPWYRIAFTLTPPFFAAVAIVILAWRSWPRVNRDVPFGRRPTRVEARFYLTVSTVFAVVLLGGMIWAG